MNSKKNDSKRVNNHNRVEASNNLFVYGTLMYGYSRNHLLQGLIFKKAILPEYRKILPPDLGFPFIIPDKNSHVEGEIYFNLTQSHWIQIDLVEGEGSLYHKIPVKIITVLDDTEFIAYVYFPSKNLINHYVRDK